MYLIHRDNYRSQPTAAVILGMVSRGGIERLYQFIRQDLEVLMHRDLVENLHFGSAGAALDGRPQRSIGSWISIMYKANCNGRIYDAIIQYAETCALVDLSVHAETESSTVAEDGLSFDCRRDQMGKS